MPFVAKIRDKGDFQQREKLSENVGIIGFGHLGSSLRQGLLKAGYDVLVNNGSEIRTVEKLNALGVGESAASLQKIASSCSVIMLCVLRDQLDVVCNELRAEITTNHMIISCLAQATLQEVATSLQVNTISVAKLMTTLGVKERMGVSAYQLETRSAQTIEPRVRKLVEHISARDCVLHLNTEDEMKLFTVAVGCFPGLISYFLRKLEENVLMEGGEQFAQYNTLFTTLLRSTANLIESAGSPQSLIQKVATKGGVTEAMVKTLEELELSKILQKSIQRGLYTMEKGKK